ncbi:UNVERIFIED_CONTAM: hypothetical protein HDU68_004622 [Siphonaria sp. JEL0065]|nr:hypothetical protein HDU68_004622 [Siphonaria sp. JEL0065]
MVNGFWKSAALKDHRTVWDITRRVLGPNDSMPLVGFNHSTTHRIDEKTIDKYHSDTLRALQMKSTAKTSRILCIPKDRITHHPLVQAGPVIPRGVARPILLWIFGNVAIHQPCHACGTPLSRDHALQCAQVLPDLDAAIGPPPIATAEDVASGATALDLYIRATKFTMEDLPRAAALARAIEQIRTVCSGYQAIYDVSMSTRQDEIDAILHDIDPMCETAVQVTSIVTAHFNPTVFDPTAPRRGRVGRRGGSVSQVPSSQPRASQSETQRSRVGSAAGGRPRRPR